AVRSLSQRRSATVGPYANPPAVRSTTWINSSPHSSTSVSSNVGSSCVTDLAPSPTSPTLLEPAPSPVLRPRRLRRVTVLAEPVVDHSHRVVLPRLLVMPPSVEPGCTSADHDSASCLPDLE